MLKIFLIIFISWQVISWICRWWPGNAERVDHQQEEPGCDGEGRPRRPKQPESVDQRRRNPKELRPLRFRLLRWQDQGLEDHPEVPRGRAPLRDWCARRRQRHSHPWRRLPGGSDWQGAPNGSVVHSEGPRPGLGCQVVLILVNF